MAIGDVSLRGIGTLRQRGSKGLWTLFGYTGGKQWTETTATDDLELAKVRAAEIKARRTERVALGKTPTVPTFCKAAKTYLRQRAAEDDEMDASVKQRANTRQKARYVMRDLVRFIGVKTRVDAVTEEKMDRFETWLKKRRKKAGKPAPSSTQFNTILAEARHIFRFAKAQQWLHGMQIPVMTNAKQSDLSRPAFTQSQVKALEEEAQRQFEASRDRIVAVWKAQAKDGDSRTWPRDRQTLSKFKLWHAIVILAWTGMRPSSLAWMIKSDVIMVEKTDLDALLEKYSPVPAEKYRLRCTTRKGAARQKTRTEAIWPHVNANDSIEALWALAPTPKSSLIGMTSDSLGKKFKELQEATGCLCTQEGMPLSIYSLRHTYLTVLMSKPGIPEKIIARNSLTSPAMLAKHYDKTNLDQFGKILSGTAKVDAASGR